MLCHSIQFEIFHWSYCYNLQIRIALGVTRWAANCENMSSNNGIMSFWYVSPNDCWQGHKKEDFLVVNRNSTNWNSPVSSNHVRCIYSPCIIPSESLKGFSVGREAKSFKWNVLTKGYSLKSNFKNFFSNVTHSTLNRPKPTNWMCAPMSTLQFYLYDFHSQFFSSWFSHFC